MLTLWSALAAAAPIDDAAADGRPIVVLVSREPRLFEAAVWLTAADGAPRERQHEVALVLASPEELAAWTGDAGLAAKLGDDPLAYALVRVSAARSVEVWADVHVPNLRDLRGVYSPHDPPPLSVSRDAGHTAPAFAARASLPGAAPPPSEPRSPRRVDAAPELPDDTFPREQYRTSYQQDTSARRAVVEAFDAALREALAGAPRRVIPPDVVGSTPGVAGAALCMDLCGLSCTLPPPSAGTPAALTASDQLFTVALCGSGHVGPVQSEFLLRWPG